jgi:hypothetical protein
MLLLGRRKLLAGLLFGITANYVLVTESFAQQTSPIGIQWTLSRSDLEAIRDSLKFDGEIQPDLSKGTDTRGLPLLYILVGTIVLPHLAEALLTLYQRLGSGVVVQSTDGGLVVSRDPAVPSDMMILKGKDGIEIKAIRQIPNSSVILDMLKAIPGAH